MHSVLGSHLIAPGAAGGARRRARGGGCHRARRRAAARDTSAGPSLPGRPASRWWEGCRSSRRAASSGWPPLSRERDRALDALHGVVGGPTPYGPATALTRAEAERLFDRTCANPIARNFLLYELYTRAAGFRSLVDPDV